MARARETLLLLIAFTIVIHILWSELEPLLPYLAFGIVAVFLGTVIYRRRRW